MVKSKSSLMSVLLTAVGILALPSLESWGQGASFDLTAEPPKGVMLGLPFGKTPHYFHGISVVLELTEKQMQAIESLVGEFTKSRNWWVQREIKDPKFEERLAEILIPRQTKLRQRIMDETERVKKDIEKRIADKSPDDPERARLEGMRVSDIRNELWKRLEKILTKHQMNLLSQSEEGLRKRGIPNAFPKGVGP